MWYCIGSRWFDGVCGVVVIVVMEASDGGDIGLRMICLNWWRAVH